MGHRIEEGGLRRLASPGDLRGRGLIREAIALEGLADLVGRRGQDARVPAPGLAGRAPPRDPDRPVVRGAGHDRHPVALDVRIRSAARRIATVVDPDPRGRTVVGLAAKEVVRRADLGRARRFHRR